MKKLFLIIAVVLIIGGGAYWYFMHPSSSPSTEVQLPPYTVPALTKEYTNETYNFALKMPEGFEATEIPTEGGGSTIVLQDKASNGVQIVVTPFDEDTGSGYTLTQERIQADVPDMQIKEPQTLEVGSNYKGLAFKSDNAAFGGASREVWFVFRGDLYQISTYERLDELLKGIFSTWQFR